MVTAERKEKNRPFREDNFFLLFYIFFLLARRERVYSAILIVAKNLFLERSLMKLKGFDSRFFCAGNFYIRSLPPSSLPILPLSGRESCEVYVSPCFHVDACLLLHQQETAACEDKARLPLGFSWFTLGFDRTSRKISFLESSISSTCFRITQW